jgi:hypothetical protein
MDIFVLLATMFFCFLAGVPIAYSLALAAALWIGIPLEAVMLKISDGVSKVAMLTIPFFVLAGAIMAEGGWHGAWLPSPMSSLDSRGFAAAFPSSTSLPPRFSVAFLARPSPIRPRSAR